MISLFDKVPRYLLGWKELGWTLIFSALFAFVFTLLSIPFSSNPWLEIMGGGSVILMVSFFLACVVIVIVSRMLLFRRGYLKGVSVFGYILWSLGEMVLVSLLYTFFTVRGERAGLIDIGDRSLLKVFFEALIFAFWCMGIPYLISCLYLSLAEKGNTMRLTDYGSVVSDAPAKSYEEKKITLFDNSGALKFSISSENLYFIESDDNYIKVWYSDSSGQVRQYMLRCRLKTVEDSFAGSDLVRCHRKYIVNITKVRILKAEKEGYKISLGPADNAVTIPISRTYEQNVLARFNSKNS